MIDAADVLHGPTNPAVGVTGPFRDATNANPVSLPQAVATSTGLTLYSADVKRLPNNFPSFATYGKIQGFAPELNKTQVFAGAWNWEVLISRSGYPGMVGIDPTVTFDGTLVLTNTTTVGQVTFVLQVAEDAAFTNPLDIDQMIMPLTDVVNSTTMATGLRAGQYV